ncbi:MAG: hypothetical protein ACRBB0_01415 [Pelagimonas sp.]|uniref:hypothetical protein n=1 Tax=Pelagimonas sp. TaxID=2073170 RepID=UPI003D6C1BF2
MIELRLDCKAGELTEKGSRRISFPVRISVLGVPASAAICDDINQLTEYVIAHHASKLSDAEIADYVRDFCEPLNVKRDRVSG